MFAVCHSAAIGGAENVNVNEKSDAFVPKILPHVPICDIFCSPVPIGCAQCCRLNGHTGGGACQGVQCWCN
ncbi:unnamed protein product, partial [Mesorhabditis belari]|uniref:Uncharacterized protein n=1 Tax=Mesorhabditis belari TaxID=2138241 RepID=A0AAF3FSW8_9BILA